MKRGPDAIHAIAALARTALEGAARVAWLLDPDADVSTRARRGLVELLYSFSEEAKIPTPVFQSWFSMGVAELVEAGDAADDVEVVRNKRGDVLHFGELRPSATDVIHGVAGSDGEAVYRELSGIAHGNITAHIRLTEPVATDELMGISLSGCSGRPTLRRRPNGQRAGSPL